MTFTPSFIAAALTRLRENMSLFTARDRVSHAIKVLSYKANQEEAARLNKLCEDINALPLNDEPMDRKRAQESLATVLTGENYATLMHKSGKEESPCAGFIPADVLLRAELSIKEAVSFIGDVRNYNSSRDIVLQALINMFTDKAGDASPCRGDGINPTDSTAPLFAYYRDELKANVTSFHYSVSGLETPSASHSGLENYFVSVAFVFGDYRIRLKWDVKTSEYIGFDEEFLNVELDGDDPEDMLNGEPDEQGNYLFDEVTEAFSELLRKHFPLGDSDIRNPLDPLRDTERRIVENVASIIA